ncbi:MAG: hypothetical protein H6634_13330 [Anaerolineales bacterium]|nr:hypothetical protein [Anaerolineales bacterium]
MKKEFAQSPELYAYAGILAKTFIQRKDLYARQLEDGRYCCIRKPLEEKHLIAHLNGDLTLGTYVLGEDNKARFAVIDADDDLQLARLAEISMSLEKAGIPSYLEASRRGGHMWIFFDRSIPGQVARAFGKQILASSGLGKIELFPKQDKLGEGPGSLIRLPFGIHQKDGQRYGFVTPGGKPIAKTFADQIYLLSNPRTVDKAALDEFISQYKAIVPKPALVKSEAVGETLSLQIKRSVTVLDFVGQYVELSPAGRGLCPFHDDHHQSFSVNAEKNYWHCFAGCGGGSIIDFWMKWQDTDFRQAVKELAGLLLNKGK